MFDLMFQTLVGHFLLDFGEIICEFVWFVSERQYWSSWLAGVVGSHPTVDLSVTSANLRCCLDGTQI